MSLRTVPADMVPAAALHAAFEAAFADYLIGPFVVPLAQWPGFLARQAVDLALSRVALADGGIAAFALVAPRVATQSEAARWRLATMGALPAARGSGAAPQLLDDFVARAAQAAVGTELEVFAQNERALRLYRGRGFEPVHELAGWRWAAGRPFESSGAAIDEAVHDLPLHEAWAWLWQTQQTLPALPLQVTPQVLSALDPGPLRAWRHGQAQLVLSLPAQGPVRVASLVDRDAAQADAQVLVRVLLQRYASRGIEVPQIQRADVGGLALQRAGFERLPLHQLLLRRPG